MVKLLGAMRKILKREYDYNALIVQDMKKLSVVQKIGVLALLALLITFYTLSIQFLLS